MPLIYTITLSCWGPKALTHYCHLKVFQLRSSGLQLCLWTFISSANSNASSQQITWKMKCILSVTTCEKAGLNYYDGNFMSRKDRILLSRLTSNYFNYSCSCCSAVPFFSAFFQNSLPNEWSSVHSSDSCSKAVLCTVWGRCVLEMIDMSHAISLHAHSQDEGKFGYIGNLALLAPLFWIWSC